MFGHHSKGYPNLANRCRAIAWIIALSFILTAPVAATDLISVATSGRSGNAGSNGVATNLDGSVVAFYSDASNLVSGDTNAVRDIFVRDLTTGTTRINFGPGGVQANAASHAAGGPPAIDADGNIIVFYSSATNLTRERDTNNVSDIFVYNRNRPTENPIMINLDPAGGQANGASLAPDINANGRFIAYQSLASNLVDGDTNGVSDIFVYDMSTGMTERVCDQTVQPNRSSFAPSISACGQFVAFASAATNLVEGDTNGLVDVFVCNRRSGEIDRVSIGVGGQGNGISILPDISASGCFVAFKSEADNLVPDDHNNHVDVFVRDRGAGATELISEAFDGGSANDGSFPPSISRDGRFVAFGSAATDLVVGDANHFPSVFVRDRLTGGIRLVDVDDAGRQANSGTPDVPTGISGNGGQIGFVSAASNLSGPRVDLNSTNDVFRAANEFVPAMVGDICCACDDDTCTEPDLGVCPPNCSPVCNAVCDPGPPGNCVSLTPPSPTPTHTLGTPTVSATPTKSLTATPTGPTATPTPTGPTATATPTGPTATATATGNTATPTGTGGTATPTHTGGTATPTHTGGTATATHTGGTATPTHTGGTATPTHTGDTATPTHTGGTATPTHTGGTATPTHTGGTATPTHTGCTATPTQTGGTATPTRTGSLTPDRTQTVVAGRRFDDDSCAIVPPGEGADSSTAVLLSLAPLALLVLRRRR